MNKWVRVNTREGTVTVEKCSDQELRWGGRNLIAKLLLREVPPTCDPIGRYNKLILAEGLLGDTILATAGRLSIGGKSPLTGGVKESSVGGEAGRKMARLGIKAVILEDAPDRPHAASSFHQRERMPSFGHARFGAARSQ